MKKNLLKSLLLTLMVLVGGNAWAQSPYFSQDYEGDGVTADWTSANTGRYTVDMKTVDDNTFLSVNAVGNGNNGTTITSTSLVDKVATDADFTLEFDLQITDGNNQASSFYIYDSANAAAKAFFSLVAPDKNSTTWNLQGSADNQVTLAKSTWFSFKIAKVGAITYLTLKNKATGDVLKDKAVIPTLSEAGGLGNMVFNTKRYYAYMAIDNVVLRDVEEGDAPASVPTTYTIKYQDANGTTLKDDIVVNSIVGLEVTATSDQAADFKVGEGENQKKWIYVSGNNSITTVEDGASNIITLVYREAGIFNYTFTAKAGETLLETYASATGFENDKIAVPYHHYYNVDGTIYQKGATSSEYNYSFVLDTDNKAVGISDYAVTEKTNVVFFKEAEDLSNISHVTDGLQASRNSFAGGGYASEEIEILTLTAGTYKLTAAGYGGAYTFKYGETTVLNMEQAGYWRELASEEFTLTETTNIVFQGGVGAGGALDYILIQSTDGSVKEYEKPFDIDAALANANFEGEFTVSSNPKEDRAIYQPAGWTLAYEGGDSNDMTALNSECLAWNNFSEKPQLGETGGKNSYWVRFRWGSAETLTLSQTITVPAGNYKLNADAFFNGANGASATIFAGENKTNITGNSTWAKHTVTFVSDGKTPVTIGFNLTQTQTVENIAAFDNFTLETYDPLADAKATLEDEIAKAEALKATEGYTAGVETFAAAIDAAKNSLASATTQEELETALATLKAAEEVFVKTNLIAANAAKVEGASLENPVAAPFVVNGTFDENTNGWTCTGGFQNKGTATNQQGAFTGKFWENWNPDAKVNKMYQVIENIPNGVYKLNIAAFVNTLANPNESQFVFANKDSVFLTTGEPTMYEVYTKVENNTLEVGLEQTTATANWMGIDNISLTYFGAEATVDQAKNAGFLKEVKDVLAAKTSVKTKRALQDAYDAYVAAATAETKAALEAALAPAKESANSYKILETGSLPDNSLDGWTCTNTQTFHINTWSIEGNSDGTGMTTPFIENWCNNSGVLGTGEIYYSLPGLDPGIYQFSALIRAYSEAGNEPTGASLFAGDREKPFNTGKRVTYNNNALIGIYDTYAMACEVGEDGVFKFGIKIAEDRNFNWMAFKSCKVAYVGGAIDADAVAELAKTMPEGKMNAEVKTAAETAIATATATPNLDNYEAAAKAIAAAQASATAYEKAAANLANMKQLTEQTNVYTAEAYDEYYGKWVVKYDEATMTNEEANALQDPFLGTGWHAAITCDNFLLSAWDTNPDFQDAPYYINTWSTEGNNDGSDFKVPFFEYWIADDSSLGEKTLTATMNNQEAGEYDVTALVRVRIKNGVEAPAFGITMQANEGEAVNVVGDQVGTSQMYLKEVKAVGTVGEDGVLKIKFIVAADNNISWLSFKNVMFEKKVTPIEPIEGVSYSWESPEGEPIEFGGKIAYVNGDGDRLNYQNSGYYTICLNGKKANLNDEVASANAGHMVITLDKAVAAGDTIAYTAFINKNETKKASAYILFENGISAEGEIFSDAENIDATFNGAPALKYTIVPDEAAGSKTITLTRSQTGTNLFITKLQIIEKKAAPVVPVTATFDFADANFREKIGTAMADVNGFIYNETFTADGASLQITGGSAPSRIYVDANRGQNLVTYTQYATLTFKAPEGKAITKIEFTAAGNSNISKFTATSGAIEGMIWTGNAEGVRFTQGATSYLANAILTLVDKDAETTALPAIEYTKCANIAAFNALAAGTYAEVTLTDAEVIGKSADGYSTVFIQDATAGCWIQYTTLNDKLNEKTKVNGTVFVMKRETSGNVQMKEAEGTLQSTLESTAIEDYTAIEGSIEEVNVAANLNKVVKITAATLEETSATAGTLTKGDATIAVNNGTETANQQLHKIADWTKDTKLENITIVAILVAKSTTENQLLPISVVDTIDTGIDSVTVDKLDGTVYNLNGQKMNKAQKGLYIINGKKVVIK